MSKKTNNELPDGHMVEVVLKKEMSMGDYRRIYAQSKQKGWAIQAYQIGKYSEGIKTKINSNEN